MDPNQVQFEEERNSAFNYKKNNMSQVPKLNQLVVKLGLAKSIESANKVLIVIAILAVLSAIGIYVYYVAGINPFVNKNVEPTRLPPELERAIKQQINNNQ